MTTKTPVDNTVHLKDEPCIHGMSNMNWCAICRQANGDKHSNTVIKAFTTKNTRKQFSNKMTTVDNIKKDQKSNH